MDEDKQKEIENYPYVYITSNGTLKRDMKRTLQNDYARKKMKNCIPDNL